MNQTAKRDKRPARLDQISCSSHVRFNENAKKIKKSNPGETLESARVEHAGGFLQAQMSSVQRERGGAERHTPVNPPMPEGRGDKNLN